MESNRLHTRASIATIAAILLGSAQGMAAQNNCTADPSAASCGLDSTAHLLRIAAFILAVLLLVILIATVAIYQRNRKRRLIPDE